MKYTSALTQLLHKRNLSLIDSKHLFLEVFNGTLPESQIKNILLLLSRKQEVAEEIAGCLLALQTLEEPIAHSFGALLMDTCGTGGDGSHSLNISTLSAFVIAGAGGKIAKHGNRGISSSCGSSDLMEAFGVRLDADYEKMLDSITAAGIGYFHAPYYHPVFSKMQPIRKKLRMRTLFNLLGPLANPCKIQCQLIGVSKKEHLRLFAEVLAHKKISRALICHSHDGLDEISVSAPTSLVWIINGSIRTETFTPAKLGIKTAVQKSIVGGDVSFNKIASLELLKGNVNGPLFDIVTLNAAFGLTVCGICKSPAEGLEAARESLQSGKALKSLETLIQISNG